MNEIDQATLQAYREILCLQVEAGKKMMALLERNIQDEAIAQSYAELAESMRYATTLLEEG